MDDIRGSLQRTVGRYGLLKQAEAARVCAIAKEVGEGSWGVVSFKDGILKLRVNSNEEGYLIKIKSDEVIKKINLALGKEAVKRLTFKVDR